MRPRTKIFHMFLAMSVVFSAVSCTPEGGPHEGTTGPLAPPVAPGPSVQPPRLPPAQAHEIAVIGWGSLIWDPRNLEKQGDFQPGGPQLPIAFSRVSSGKRCPGCLTLVIDVPSDAVGRKPSDEAGRPVSTWFAHSSFPYSQLEEAIKNLTKREGAKLPAAHGEPHPIGFVDLGRNKFRISQIDPTSGKTETIHGKIQHVAEDADGVEILSGSGVRRELIPFLKGLIAWTASKRFEASIWTDLQRNFKEKTGKKFNQENLRTYLRGLAPDVRSKALEYIKKAPVRSQTRDGDVLVDVLEHTARD